MSEASDNPNAPAENGDSRSQQRIVGPIPREELKQAMMKDFEQHMIDSYTPDRGYAFPVDNVEALISKYWPNGEVSGAGATASNEQPKSATRQRSLD